MIDELEWVKRSRPNVDPPTPDARLAAAQALERAIDGERDSRRPRVAPRRRLRIGWLAPVAGLVVVAAVVAVFLGVRHQASVPPAVQGGQEYIFRAAPKAPHGHVDQAAVTRAAAVIRQRLAAVDPNAVKKLSVSATGDEIRIRIGRGAGIGRAQLLPLLDTLGPLTFYDWEANVLTPNGTTVASQLAEQAPDALRISQGGASGGPGFPGIGTLSLYNAVQLASRQPQRTSPGGSRVGPEYFTFGAPGSGACAAAASYYSTPLDPRSSCYLSGPSATQAQAIATLPPGVAAGEARAFAVQQGTVVLEAVPSSYAHGPAWSNPAAQFYVLRDRASLFGSDVTNPRQSVDQSGAPDVTMDLTATGARRFHHVSAGIARRGALVSGFGQTLNQHFAVAIDDELLTVASIDYRTYPDGVPAQSVDVVGGLTVRSAQALASQIRLGSLPVALVLVSGPS
jgi:hypothetical protein